MNIYRFILFVSILLVSISSASSQVTLVLEPGWNLVSFPMGDRKDLVPYLEEHLLDSTGNPADIASVVQKIWSYENGWSCYEPAGGTSCSMTKLNPNYGYWFLLNKGAVLSYSLEDFSPLSLQINNPGWALAGLNIVQDTSISEDVLSKDAIQSNHSPKTVKRVFAYENGWNTHSVSGTEDSPVHSGMDTMKPGHGYWFLLESVLDKPVNELNPFILRPRGFYPEAALVIGGASSLIPPEVSNVSASVSYSMNSISGVTPSTPEQDGKCDLNHPDKIVGYALARGIDGRQLNNHIPAPIVCADVLDRPLQWKIEFSSEELQHFRAYPELLENLTVKLDLFSGQSEKAFFSEQVSALLTSTEEIPQLSDLEVNSKTTLSTALMGMEISKKAGLSYDSVQLGEAPSQGEIYPLQGRMNVPLEELHLDRLEKSLNQGIESESSLLSQYADLVSNLNSKDCNTSFGGKDYGLVHILSGRPFPCSSGVSLTIENAAQLKQISSLVAEMESLSITKEEEQFSQQKGRCVFQST